jgi:hypothetical protein
VRSHAHPGMVGLADVSISAEIFIAIDLNNPGVS